MPEKYKEIYRTESTRLKRFNYSSDGFYFITICTTGRWDFFGKVKNEVMFLSKAGEIAQKNWLKISQQYKNIKVDEFIIMPDHVQGIIEIGNGEKGFIKSNDKWKSGTGDAMNRVSTSDPQKPAGGITSHHNPMLNEGSIPNIIRWYKGKTSFDIRKKFPLEEFQWQPKFHDRIIRSKKELWNVRQYIKGNPKNSEKEKQAR